MPTNEAEAIAVRLERAFAHNDWTAFYRDARALYDQGLRDGGAVPAGTAVDTFPAEVPPPPAAPPKAPPAAPSCPGCGGTGERTVSFPKDPRSPVSEPRTAIAACPDCAGGTVPPRTEPERPAGTFTGGAEIPRSGGESPAHLPVALSKPPSALPLNGNRFVLAGNAVVDRETKAVAYTGPDAAKVYEALSA